VSQENVRHRELAMIHVAKKQLGMEDDAYRALLWSIARVNSAADLDWAGRKQLLDHMKKCGFKARPPKAAGARALEGDPQSQMILALWLQLHNQGVVRDPSEHALAAWVKRQTGVDAIRWLNRGQKVALIESLKAWADRTRR
jgi:phage gp16-like protein